MAAASRTHHGPAWARWTLRPLARGALRRWSPRQRRGSVLSPRPRAGRSRAKAAAGPALSAGARSVVRQGAPQPLPPHRAAPQGPTGCRIWTPSKQAQPPAPQPGAGWGPCPVCPPRGSPCSQPCHGPSRRAGAICKDTVASAQAGTDARLPGPPAPRLAPCPVPPAPLTVADTDGPDHDAAQRGDGGDGDAPGDEHHHPAVEADAVMAAELSPAGRGQGRGSVAMTGARPSAPQVPRGC